MHANLSVNAAHLLAVLAHVSTDKTRRGLAGVHFEPCGVMVATDGRTLLASRGNGCAELPPEGVSLVFPRAAVPLLRKAAKRNTRAFIKIREDMAELLLPAGNAALQILDTTPTTGVPFPPWRQVIPMTDSFMAVPEIGFDVNLAARFAGMPGLALCFRFTGETRAVVVTGTDPDLLGLWMPVQTKFSEKPDPRAWLPSTNAAD